MNPWTCPSVLFLLALLLVERASAGCFQQRLCCPGRNHSCRAKDDGIDHLPTLAPLPQDVRLLDPPPGGQRPCAQKKVGNLILDERNSPYKYDMGFDSPPSSLQLIFGLERESESVPSENVRYNRKKQPVIRYSLLNKHLPLTVSRTHKAALEEDESALRFLAEPLNDCFCDEDCVLFGDCCSDYTFVCPPSDCQVSSWGAWGDCLLDGGGRCGRGVQRRTRTVVKEPFHGGAKCPRLRESKACFVSCRRRSVASDVTTVALLLDYRHNRTREKWRGHGRPRKLARLSYYCVEYEINWTNPNCVGVDAKKLVPQTTICAECQPEAQLHRKSRRCASDLEDGEIGFWKVNAVLSSSGCFPSKRSGKVHSEHNSVRDRCVQTHEPTLQPVPLDPIQWNSRICPDNCLDRTVTFEIDKNLHKENIDVYNRSSLPGASFLGADPLSLSSVQSCDSAAEKRQVRPAAPSSTHNLNSKTEGAGSFPPRISRLPRASSTPRAHYPRDHLLCESPRVHFPVREIRVAPSRSMLRRSRNTMRSLLLLAALLASAVSQQTFANTRFDLGDDLPEEGVSQVRISADQDSAPQVVQRQETAAPPPPPPTAPTFGLPTFPTVTFPTMPTISFPAFTVPPPPTFPTPGVAAPAPGVLPPSPSFVPPAPVVQAPALPVQQPPQQPPQAPAIPAQATNPPQGLAPIRVKAAKVVTQAPKKSPVFFADDFDLKECAKKPEFLAQQFARKFPQRSLTKDKVAKFETFLALRLRECQKKETANHWEHIERALGILKISTQEEDDCRSGLVQEQIACANIRNYVCQFAQKSFRFRSQPAKTIIQEARLAEDGSEKCRKIVKVLKKKIEKKTKV
uniref:SMB domain-containing protein n=1 Tax=Steinernema glaseri TaxID=37863 RepID=A0A1I7ZTH1_9BILA